MKRKRTSRYQKRRILRGFTFLELLVVIGVVSLLLGITILAINPLEQTSRASDATTEITAQDFINASVQYFAEANKLPWQADSNCMTQITAGGTLDEMPDCVHLLAQSGTLERTYLDKQELKEIHVRKCGDSAVLCYNPKSKKEYEEGGATYTKFGVNDPGCPGKKGDGSECYWCKPVMGKPTCEPPVTPTVTPTSSPTSAPTVVPTSPPTATPSPSPTAVPTVTPTTAPIACGQLGNFPADIPTHAGEMKAFLWSDEGSFLICKPPQPGPYSLHASFDPNFSAPIYDGMHTMPVYDGTRGSCCNTFYGLSFPQNYTWGWPYQHFGDLVESLIIRPNNGGYGFIPAKTVWANYQCGKTLYWRLVDYYNPSIIKSDTHADVISCTPSLKLYYVNWTNLYFDANSKTQKQYNAQWDGNLNGVMDEEDYWWQVFRGQVSVYP